MAGEGVAADLKDAAMAGLTAQLACGFGESGVPHAWHRLHAA
jgi:hypothetical protein